MSLDVGSVPPINPYLQRLCSFQTILCRHMSRPLVSCHFPVVEAVAALP